MENTKLDDSTVRDIYGQILKAAADCLSMGPSEDQRDWKLHKTTGVKDRRSISRQAEVINEKNRKMALRLRGIADNLLSAHKNCLKDLQKIDLT